MTMSKYALQYYAGKEVDTIDNGLLSRSGVAVSRAHSPSSTTIILYAVAHWGSPVPYSSPKSTSEDPTPRKQVVSGLPGFTNERGGPVTSPYKSLTTSPNETIAAYISFDGASPASRTSGEALLQHPTRHSLRRRWMERRLERTMAADATPQPIHPNRWLPILPMPMPSPKPSTLPRL
ncbi:hypothetical protein BDV95DRAFT_563252 [Massariosphaeria phaeospora]|uniref:Uncharacterized protein n=1 Tax=Massariosphaeria phaeospora TaxID=100035 RepID=A0A7C8ME74_9PLEO|nr:hypothetical protein BDV95DRAFT_563252 [Massariosphaeria phaeospora]